ncbi:MAG: FimB/Mfa2 family fimbrial subunit [Prevotella sp.]|nr:FimB/Mfa2 family fimbrial subunit [Prevotella sp.]
MKKKILSVILVVAGLFSGCSSEEVVSRPETIGQAGTLIFSFPVPRRSVTYAIASGTTAEEAVDATAGEVEINDVTVYMFENSEEGTLVARKTASPEEAGAHSVKFDVDKFAAAGNGDYIFYAVANVNRNITDNFVVGSTTLNDFTSAVATDTGTTPVSGSNMLMVGYVAIDNLSTQTEPVQTINLRHRVARFDVDNLTEDSDAANDNLAPGSGGNEDETFFRITKIHILNTKSSGYLTAETNGQARTPVSGRVSFKGDKAIDVSGISGINEIPVEGAFYLWPGVLADKDHYLVPDSTVIEVEGIYTGDNKVEIFTVYLETGKEIETNKRYTLKVKRISRTALSVDLFASDWGEGGEVTAMTTGVSSVYGGFELLVGGEDESVQLSTTVDLSGNKGDNDNELRFYTESDGKATDALTASLDEMTLGPGYASNVIVPVPDGDPVVTYSIGKVRQYYKIILPKTTYPIEGKLTIKDENTQQSKVLNVKSVPVYENTIYTPVLVNGKYWAPVNVGATSTSHSTTPVGCGYIFQWGRNVPFTYDTTTDIYDGGPVTPGTTPVEDYENKFIKTTADPHDWLLGGEVSGRWQGDNAQGPCPVGWRVPTEAELTGLGTGNFSSGRLAIAGVGATLYLPAAGIRYYDGAWNRMDTYGYYWSSTVSSTGAMRLGFSSGTPTVVAGNRAEGCSVRCIQE